MISIIQRNRLPAVESLERLAGPLQPLTRDRWSLPAHRESAVVPTARLREGWLTLEAACNGAALPSQSQAGYLSWLLELNPRLGPCCKLGLGPTGDLVLTAEMPLDDESATSAADRMEAFVGGFRDALSQVQCEDHFSSANIDGTGTDTTPLKDTDADAVADLVTRLAQSCDETGWSYERRDTSLALALDTYDDCYHQPELVPQADGSTHLGFQLSVEPSDSPACGLATAVLLLRTCHTVRGVRATLNHREEHYPYGFEATWDEIPTPSDLCHALTELSLAARLCGAETKSLQQEPIAKRFLTLQGWSLEGLTATASPK